MRKKFDEQLALLNSELIKMGALCEDAIAASAEALLHVDLELAARLDPLAQKIEEKEKDIETLCLKLILQQQPVARDLRQVSAALKMITDMGRIGNQSADIAELIEYLQGNSVEEFHLIAEMSQATIQMVTESIDAFVKQDEELAQQVIAYDDVVDDLFIRIKASLITLIKENPEEGEYAIDLLMIAKYFERIGDHAVNVAEWVVFAITGMHRGEDS